MGGVGWRGEAEDIAASIGPKPPVPSRLRAAASALAALAYPSLCAGCDRRVAGGLVCDACLPSLPRPEPGDAAATFARWPDAERPEHAVALWRYDAGGTVQRIQHALKYRGLTDAARPLGRILGEATATALRGRADAVVPIPLSRPRELERGFNQAAVLAEGVAAALAAPCRGELLVRTRATQSQARLDATARRLNVDGAFLPTAPLDGLHVLLVDDVLTTGATLAAATAVCREAGARVSVAVLALADRSAG